MGKTCFVVLLVLLMAGCSGDSESTEQKSLFDMNVEEMFPGNELAQKLALAAADGDIREIDDLVAKGANVNAIGTRSLPVLVWPLLRKNKAGFRHLLLKGADPNTTWKTGGTVIHWATVSAPEIGVDFLEMCLSIGSGNPNIKNPITNERPLELALALNNNQAFATLYNAGAVIDYADWFGRSFVRLATGMSNYEVAYFLLKEGVDYKSKDNNGKNIADSINQGLKYWVGAKKLSHPQNIWMWRCINFLEQRGMSFKIQQYNPRPATITDAPVTLFDDVPKQILRSRSVSIHEVSLTYPTPAWAQDQESRRNLQSFFRQKGSNIIYEFIPKGESLNNWNQYQTVTGIYSPNTSYEAFLQAAKDKLVSRCQSDTQMELTEKQADSQLLHVVCDNQDMEGYLFLGKYKNTFVTVYQAWRRTAVKNPEQRRAKVLADMKGIKMEQGFNVVPMTDEMKQKIKQ